MSNERNQRLAQASRVPAYLPVSPGRGGNLELKSTKGAGHVPDSPNSARYPSSNMQQTSKMIVQALSHSRVRHEAERLMKKYENPSHALDREGFRKVLRELDSNGREPLPANFE